jgi:Iap family predicted aminopeptidase
LLRASQRARACIPSHVFLSVQNINKPRNKTNFFQIFFYKNQEMELDKIVSWMNKFSMDDVHWKLPQLFYFSNRLVLGLQTLCFRRRLQKPQKWLALLNKIVRNKLHVVHFSKEKKIEKFKKFKKQYSIFQKISKKIKKKSTTQFVLF